MWVNLDRNDWAGFPVSPAESFMLGGTDLPHHHHHEERKYSLPRSKALVLQHTQLNCLYTAPFFAHSPQREGRLSMFWGWFDFQLRGGLGLLLYLSDGEATKTLGGSGAFCFITWKWDTLPLLSGKSISSLLPLSHWILSCRLLLETSSQSSVNAIDSWIAFTNTARSQNY